MVEAVDAEVVADVWGLALLVVEDAVPVVGGAEVVVPVLGAVLPVVVDDVVVELVLLGAGVVLEDSADVPLVDVVVLEASVDEVEVEAAVVPVLGAVAEVVPAVLVVDVVEVPPVTFSGGRLLEVGTELAAVLEALGVGLVAAGAPAFGVPAAGSDLATVVAAAVVSLACSVAAGWVAAVSLGASVAAGWSLSLAMPKTLLLPVPKDLSSLRLVWTVVSSAGSENFLTINIHAPNPNRDMTKMPITKIIR